MRGLAKAKAPAAELQAACAGQPNEAALAAGTSGRPKAILAAFQAFRDGVAALAGAGAPAGDVLAACDRCVRRPVPACRARSAAARRAGVQGCGGRSGGQRGWRALPRSAHQAKHPSFPAPQHARRHAGGAGHPLNHG